MDPSSWVNYTAAQHYSRLRAGGNHHQMNVHPNVGLNVPSQSGQLNMNDHLSINSANQAMTSHYGGSAAAHPWLFTPHGLNASHQGSNHHTDHASSFNPSPFLHHTGYDASSFLSGPFQSAAAKASYIPTATGFFNPMKKSDMTNDMSNLRGAPFTAQYPPMNMNMNMSMAPPNINNMTSDPNSNLAAGNIFSSHLGPSSWRHHPNLMSTNSGSGPFGVLPHEAVNVMNTGSAPSAHSHTSHHAPSAHTNKSESSKQHHHHHHHHKSSSSSSSSAASAAAASAMVNTDNTYRNIIAPQTGYTSSSRNQNVFDTTTSAKLAHHHQTDPYNFAAAAAAAAAMNHAMTASEYATMQQSRYAGMTSNQHAFTNNSASRGSYPTMAFSADPSARSRELLSTSSFLHSAKQNPNNAYTNRSMSVMNASSYLSNCGMMMMNASNNYSPSPAHSANNTVTNNVQAVNASTSRSSSAASNHPLQQGNENSSCSYSYGSPATNLPHSPYQQPQRSNASTSSQGTPNASVPVANVQQTAPDFTTYSNSQVYPSMGTPAPTSTPGYPTPPSSVGQTHQNSQAASTASNHDDSVSHYSQLTPQTPSSQTPFAGSYTSTYPTTPKLPSNSNRTSTESLLPNTSSSCMVAAAAANMSVTTAPTVSQRTSSGYMMQGPNIHESDAESCLSNIVNVNSLGNGISNTNKLSDAQIRPSADVTVMGHQNEPTLNSVFASQDIDFPSISFPTNDDTANSYGVSGPVKLETNSFHKKKNKSGKKSKKKDKNKVISMNQTSPYSAGYNYSQYQNSYPLPLNDPNNAYMMQQQSSQPPQTHSIMSSNSTAESTASAPACYDMQYQHIPTHQHEQPLQHQHDPLQALHHDTLQQSVQQQHEMSMEPVMPLQNQQQQQQQQPQANQLPPVSVNDKTSFPTIDDELSFLTEPTAECVNMETQTQTQAIPEETPIPVTSVATSVVSTPPVEDSNVLTTVTNSNSSQGSASAQATPAGFLKSFMSFIDASRLEPSLTPVIKEKKKKKHKDASVNDGFNGQKTKNNKKRKTCDAPFDGDDVIKDDIKPNLLSLIEKHSKFESFESTAIKKTGDNKDYESKFFKRRPSSNVNVNVNVNAQIIDIKCKEPKSTKKRKQSKNDNHMMNAKPHDEYEFPDSPLTNTKTTKKQRKSCSSDSSKKKQIPTFEKLSSVPMTVSFKKTPAQKKSVPSSAVTANQTLSNNSNTKPIVVAKNCDTNDGCAINNDSTTPNLKPQKLQLTQQPMQSLAPQQPQPELTSQLSQIQNHAQHLNQQKSKPTNKEPLLNQSQQTQNSQKKQTLSQLSNKKNSLNKQLTPATVTPVTSAADASNNNCSTVLTTTAASNNVTTHSVGMQSAGTNTPRRRSQDKKASTIREGLMRTGDFVVAIEESQYDLPVIWRIEGKSLLQRFEPSEQDGITVYINTSSYSAWNPTVRQRYTGVDVRVMGCSRTRIVVEKLGLSQFNANNVNGVATIERVTGYNKSASSAAASANSTFHHQENFEVFIQTLISQALDPNFISEIVKENDEYFLSHVQAIDDVCSRKKSRFFSKIKWDANIVKCVETYPLFTVTPQDNIGDLRCRLCNDNWSTQILQFSGEPYHSMTLEPQPAVDMKQTKYAACDSCKDKIVLYSHLHHQKYYFFQKCKSKVEDMRGGDENKESHVILEQCLQDTEWINTLFKQLEEIWLSCDKIR